MSTRFSCFKQVVGIMKKIYVVLIKLPILAGTHLQPAIPCTLSIPCFKVDLTLTSPVTTTWSIWVTTIRGRTFQRKNMTSLINFSDYLRISSPKRRSKVQTNVLLTLFQKYELENQLKQLYCTAQQSKEIKLRNFVKKIFRDSISFVLFTCTIGTCVK